MVEYAADVETAAQTVCHSMPVGADVAVVSCHTAVRSHCTSLFTEMQAKKKIYI